MFKDNSLFKRFTYLIDQNSTCSLLIQMCTYNIYLVVGKISNQITRKNLRPQFEKYTHSFDKRKKVETIEKKRYNDFAFGTPQAFLQKYKI